MNYSFFASIVLALSLTGCGIEKLGKGLPKELGGGGIDTTNTNTDTTGADTDTDTDTTGTDDEPPVDPLIQAGAVPTVTLPADTPIVFSKATLQDLPFLVEGLRDANFDVVPQVWSPVANNGMGDVIAEGTKRLTAAPWLVPKELLMNVPVGKAQLQLLVRVNNQVKARVDLDITVGP